MSLVGGTLALDCPECVIDMNPMTWGYLAAGYNFTVDVTASVPLGQTPGDYWTYIRASSADTSPDDCLLNITVPLNSSWYRVPESFAIVLAPPNTNGTIGNITVNNTGNVKIAFRVYRTENGSDFVTVTPYFFELDKQTPRNITVTYILPPSETEGMYYVKLLIRNDTAIPPEYVTDFWLNVTDIPPNITDISIHPTTFEIIYENVSISANITDNFNVSTAWINVSRPGDLNYINTSKMIHNLSMDSRFNYTEEISTNYTATMQFFNITVYNYNGTDMYFDLTVNDFLIVANQHVSNYTVSRSKLIHSAATADSGFNYTETETNETSQMEYFNLTIYNYNGTTIYFNLTVNGATIASNHSLANDTNYTVDITESLSFTLPGNQTINLTIFDENGTSGNASYDVWLHYAMTNINITIDAVAEGASFTLSLIHI